MFEKAEVEELKRFDEPGLVLMGFKPINRLKLHHHIRPSLFVFPEEEMVTGGYRGRTCQCLWLSGGEGGGTIISPLSVVGAGSSCLFTALLRRCSERGVFAVCKYTPRHNTPPRFVALVPQREELDDDKVQVTPAGMTPAAVASGSRVPASYAATSGHPWFATTANMLSPCQGST